VFKKVLFVLLLLIVAIPACGLGYLYLRQPAQAPPSAVKVSMAPERIERGRYIFTTLSECDGCHSERDFTRVGGPVVVSGRGKGNILSDFEKGFPGQVVAPNITPDMETGIGSWTDGEKIRAIREGIDKSGRALFPMMPYQAFAHMSDYDVESVVAFLDSLPPIKNALPATQLSFPTNLMIKGAPQPVARVPEPDRGNKLKYGEYLVTLADCGGCHTQAEKGQPLPGMEFAGGNKFETIIGTVLSANISQDMDTGIGKWNEEHFLKKFADYKEYAAVGPPKATGPDAFTLMPWLPFSQLNQEDLSAIFTYLKTVKPVKNYVETHPGVKNSN
jgi:mono/diheme cytochrome c family protein